MTDLLGCFLLSLLVASAPEIGAWLNARAARKTLRLMHYSLYRCAPELCTPECWE